MISRRTTLLLAELFEHAFRAGHGFTSRGYTYYPVAEGQVYDFL